MATETMTATAEEQKVSLRALMEAFPDDGPKSLCAKLKEEDAAKFGDMNFNKVKKIQKVIRDDMEQEREAKKAAVQKLVDDMRKLKMRQGTKDNCPLEHGLCLHRTTHSGFCCDVCRCYVPTGAEMRGCRLCDWDVCLKCAPVSKTTIEDLKRRFAGIEARVEQQKGERSALAQVESELHKMEKNVDSYTAQDLVDNAPVEISVEDMRDAKKALLRSMEALQVKIDDYFAVLKGAAEKKEENA